MIFEPSMYSVALLRELSQLKSDLCEFAEQDDKYIVSLVLRTNKMTLEFDAAEWRNQIDDEVAELPSFLVGAIASLVLDAVTTDDLGILVKNSPSDKFTVVISDHAGGNAASSVCSDWAIALMEAYVKYWRLKQID